MTQRKRISRIPLIQDVSVIDLLLLDHQYLKGCIEILVDEDADKSAKFSVAKGFLEAVNIHSLAEKRAIYAPLESNEELHFNILEAEIEHGIIDQKVRSLKLKVANSRTLKDELEAELKVLAELLKHHLLEEEGEMFHKMKAEVDEQGLIEMGQMFMKLRKFTPDDLAGFPVLEDELIQWKDSVQKLNAKFFSRMDKYVENLKH